jgi:phosphoribosylaminoimidazole carboxylase
MTKLLGSNNNGTLYAEKWVNYEKELAVMVVSSINGITAYPVVQTIQENNVCSAVLAPAPSLNEAIIKRAKDIAISVVASLPGEENYGVFGVELFLCSHNNSSTSNSNTNSSSSRNKYILFNEVAPRPHNSGHYTIETCILSQFTAHLRAILNLPIPPENLQMHIGMCLYVCLCVCVYVCMYLDE